MDITSIGAIRGQVRDSHHRRVMHGLYRLVTPHATPREDLLADLTALSLLLPEGTTFTHVTGAMLLGWQLPALPEQTPFFVAMRGDKRPRRAGLVAARLTHDAEPRMVDGFRVEAPEEILLRAARDLGELDLAIMLDSALRRGDVTEQSLAPILASRRPGTRLLRRALSRASALAESAGETVLRRFHDAIDVPTSPQVELFDDSGLFVGRADLLVLGTTDVHEYDGVHHRRPDGQRADLRRERRFASSAYKRRGYTLDELLNHPAATMHEIDRALGRPHRPERLVAWRTLVDDSLYSIAGRERVMNRWLRHRGHGVWARTA